MGDKDFFYLIPNAQLPSNILSEHGHLFGGPKPVSVVSGPEVPEDTVQYINFNNNA